MSEKVKVWVFDGDCRVRTDKSFPLTKDGGKIAVKSGGKAHFNPSFDNDSCLYFPKRSILPPFRKHWEAQYIVRKGANACVNFKTGDVPSYNEEQILKAAENKILQNIGKEKQETPLVQYAILALNLLIFLILTGVTP